MSVHWIVAALTAAGVGVLLLTIHAKLRPAPDVAEPTPAPENFVFPAVAADEFGGHHFDPKTQVIWIGIRLTPGVHDFFGARAFLFGYEHTIWEYYKAQSEKQRARQNLAIRPKQPAPAPTGILKIGG